MAKKSYDMLFKLLLIGDSGVGKTCMLFSYVDGAYSPTYISTIGIDFKIKTIEIGGKKIKLQIWDTAGQERFHTITMSYYRGAMGIMLVYDITARKSFENISRWLGNIHQHASETVEVIIVANKSDMVDRRSVTQEEGLEAAGSNGIKYIETSAKTGENINTAFEELTMAILKKCPREDESRSYGAQKLSQNVPRNGSYGSKCCQY